MLCGYVITLLEYSTASTEKYKLYLVKGTAMLAYVPICVTTPAKKLRTR